MAYRGHLLLPNLWMGPKPPEGNFLRGCGFTTIVLCAQEHQPDAEAFPGLVTLRAKLDDSKIPITEEEWRAALACASTVSEHLFNGGRVLVTCWQGRNRSGLVAALALVRFKRMTGEQALEHVQAHRPGALANASFEARLRALPAPRR